MAYQTSYSSPDRATAAHAEIRGSADISFVAFDFAEYACRIDVKTNCTRPHLIWTLVSACGGVPHHLRIFIRPKLDTPECWERCKDIKSLLVAWGYLCVEVQPPKVARATAKKPGLVDLTAAESPGPPAPDQDATNKPAARPGRRRSHKNVKIIE